MVPLSGLHAIAQTVPGFVISETRHARGVLAAHAHAHAGYCLVVGGRFAELERGRETRVGRGALIARPAGAEHGDRFEPGGAICLNVEVTGGAIVQGEVGVITAGPAVWAATRARAALLAGDRLALEAACWELARGARLDERRTPAWLARIEQLIATRFAEPWSLAELAAIVEVHPAHLSRAYRRARGTSVVAALHGRRVAAAASRLAASPAPLAEIATACGFYDQPYFTRVFRRATGLTPAAYRRAAGSDRTRRDRS